MSELNRFYEAQEEGYPRALSEIKNGMKVSHWMWYIFPQITGLGYSSTAQYYAIKDLEEANEYLNDEVLGNRLREISLELLKLETNIPVMVFGMVDSLKLNSSMTLFLNSRSITPILMNLRLNSTIQELKASAR